MPGFIFPLREDEATTRNLSAAMARDENKLALNRTTTGLPSFSSRQIGRSRWSSCTTAAQSGLSSCSASNRFWRQTKVHPGQTRSSWTAGNNIASPGREFRDIWRRAGWVCRRRCDPTRGKTPSSRLRADRGRGHATLCPSPKASRSFS
jgi:hypothetical protein